MENNQTNTEHKDPKLWSIARKRAGFKRHLKVYLLVNALLWAIWLFNIFTKYLGQISFHMGGNFPWPAYVTFFWGIGLLFNFYETYYLDKGDMVDKEYQKLKNKNK